MCSSHKRLSLYLLSGNGIGGIAMTNSNQSDLSSEESGDALLSDWIRYKSSISNSASNTVVAYQRDVQGFLDFLSAHLGEKVILENLRSASIREMRSWMASERRNGVSSRTLARRLSAVKGFFAWIGERDGFDPASLMSVRAPKFQRGLPRPVSPQSAIDIIENVENGSAKPWVKARDSAVLALLYGCGLRVSEALALEWSCHPLPDSLRILGKGGKERIVPTLPAAREAVTAYAKLCPFARDPDKPMFRGIRGGVLNQRTVRAIMESARNSLGLPASATPHALRHSFASHLLRSSGDLRAIQELLGHSSLSTTQTYTEVDQSHLVEVCRNTHPRG